MKPTTARQPFIIERPVTSTLHHTKRDVHTRDTRAFIGTIETSPTKQRFDALFNGDGSRVTYHDTVTDAARSLYKQFTR